uniref:Copper transport protein n=1 Tax=Parastrongyloides trichosuri TaxID=131310 RepID=A0A0N4Z7U3_PARTI
MVLHFGSREIILFNFWKTGSFSGILGSMIIIFLICFTYEGIRKARIWMAKYELRITNNEEGQENYHQRLTPGDNERLSSSETTRMTSIFSKIPTYRIVHALLYGLQTILSFTIMLIIMTFNGWIIIATLLGLTVGYFTFNKTPLEEMPLRTCC